MCFYLPKNRYMIPYGSYILVCSDNFHIKCIFFYFLVYFVA